MRRPALLLILFAAAAATAQTTEHRAIVEGALAQVGVTRGYDPAYHVLHYPGGDLPLDRGVCTDVVIRSFRKAGLDLQRLVHEDMAAHFALYPHAWGLTRPDTNIDHRRVPNLATFFRRRGKSLGVSTKADDYAPGDVVTWRLPFGAAHIGVVTDRKAGSGRPLVVHNIGSGAQLEDVLFAYTVTGHYRW